MKKELEEIIEHLSLKHGDVVGYASRKLVNELLENHHERRRLELALKQCQDRFRSLWLESFDHVEPETLRNFLYDSDEGDCLITLNRTNGALKFQDPKKHTHDNGNGPTLNVHMVPIRLSDLKKMVEGDADTLEELLASIPHVDTED